MKPLTLEETKLKEEMKERCLAKGQYKDENAKAKFNMLCHLEDFEIQYWKLQKENEILKQNAENNDKVVDKVNWENQLLKKENKELKLQLKGTTHCFDEEEHEKLKKQVEEYEKELETWKKKYPNRAEKIK